MKYAPVIFFLWISLNVAAENCGTSLPDLCAQRLAFDRFKQADADLNHEFHRVIRSSQGSRRQRLIESQIEWNAAIRYDGCAKRTEEEWEGTCPITWCIVAEQECQIEATKTRTLELRRLSRR